MVTGSIFYYIFYGSLGFLLLSAFKASLSDSGSKAVSRTVIAMGVVNYFGLNFIIFMNTENTSMTGFYSAYNDILFALLVLLFAGHEKAGIKVAGLLVVFSVNQTLTNLHYLISIAGTLHVSPLVHVISASLFKFFYVWYYEIIIALNLLQSYILIGGMNDGKRRNRSFDYDLPRSSGNLYAHNKIKETKS